MGKEWVDRRLGMGEEWVDRILSREIDGRIYRILSRERVGRIGY